MEIETTQEGAIVSQRHYSGEHVLRVDFEPPLPPLAQLQDGQRYGYRLSWDGQTHLVEGVLVLTNSGTVAEGRVPNNYLDHVEDANSNHSQGVNFQFGDGSVRSIQNTT